MATKAKADALARIEKQIATLKERRTKLMHKRPRERVKDYVLKRAGAGSVKLSELFGDKQDLLVIHNMGAGCPFCTLWADGFEGYRPHLENRAAFALVSNDDPKTAAKFTKGRGWKCTVLSGKDSAFTKDMGYYSKNHGSNPGVSAFRKDPDGKIYRVAHTFFGPGDDFCAVWPFLDLLQDGPAGWVPQYKY